MNVHYAPPEFCCIKSQGGTVYPMHPSADVWSFGLVLADIAGLSRTITCDNKDGRWIGHLATMDDGKYKVPVRKSTQPMLVCFVVFLSEQAAPCVRQWDEG